MSSNWRRRTLHLCFGYLPGVTPLIASPATTPGCEPHTPQPSGYLEWHEWAEEMAKTCDQRQCAGCGKWSIWEPKEKADAGAGS